MNIFYILLIIVLAITAATYWLGSVSIDTAKDGKATVEPTKKDGLIMIAINLIFLFLVLWLGGILHYAVFWTAAVLVLIATLMSIAHGLNIGVAGGMMLFGIFLDSAFVYRNKPTSSALMLGSTIFLGILLLIIVIYQAYKNQDHDEPKKAKKHHAKKKVPDGTAILEWVLTFAAIAVVIVLFVKLIMPLL